MVVRHIVLAGGGTAGHVNPLLAVAQALRSSDAQNDIVVVGTHEGLEQRLVPAQGFTLETIDKVPFPRRPNKQAFTFFKRFKRAVNDSIAILQKNHAQVVVGFGGYASAPVYVAAHKLGIPIIIHEQNARAGMANILGARWAVAVACAYQTTNIKVPHGERIHMGLPLRPAIADMAQKLEENQVATRESMAQKLGLDPDRLILAVTGGSLGALSLNTAVSHSAQSLCDVAQVVHLTGRNKDAAVRETVREICGKEPRELGEPASQHTLNNYIVAPYFEHIEELFACADLVICRSGAGTVSELAALGVPAVYVPLPIGNGEQRLNAAELVAAGGGVLVSDKDVTPEWVCDRLVKILQDTYGLQRARKAAYQHGIRDAAQRMVTLIYEHTEQSQEA